MRIFILIGILVIIQISSIVKAEEGIEYKIIDSKEFDKNIVKISSSKKIGVYLPPSYGKGMKRYPVIYYLCAYSHSIDGFLNWVDLNRSMNEGIEKTGKEFIFVMIEGTYKLGGSFYLNSSGTGNWENFIIKEAIPFVDNNYRSVDNREFRGFLGLSMGGNGVLNIGMKYPEYFGALYCISPAIFNENGLTETFLSEDRIKSQIKYIKYLSSLPENKRIEKMLKTNGELEAEIAYGLSCSPKGEFPYIEFPYDLETGKLDKESKAYENWKNGAYGGFKKKVELYKENLERFNGNIVIEYGKKDEYDWIPKGCEYFMELMNNAGIKYEKIIIEDGGHGDKTPERLGTVIYSYFAKRLKNIEKGTEDK